jgi:para-nitrobenzyl esterase
LVGAAESPSLLALYPANKYAPDQYALAYVAADIVTDASLRGLGGAYNIKLAKELSVQVPTFFYEFADPLARGPSANGFERKAAHGSDVAYFWAASIPTPDTTFAGGSGSRQLSNEMIKYFGAFVRNHNPTVSGQVAWPAMTPTNKSVMSLLPAGGSKVVDVSVLDALHNYDYWMSRPIVLDRGEIPPAGGCPEYCP